MNNYGWMWPNPRQQPGEACTPGGHPIPQADQNVNNEPVEQRPADFIGHAGLAHYERAWQSQLARIREQHPGMVIIPFPDTVLSFSSSVASTVRKVVVPPVAKLFTIGSTVNPTMLSKNAFTLPFTASTSDITDDNATGPIVSSSIQFGNIWYPCEGLTEIYLGTTVANSAICVGFWNGFSPKLLEPKTQSEVIDKRLTESGK